MGECKVQRDLYSFNKTIISGVSYQKTEPLYNQYKEQGRKGTTLTDPSRGREEIRWRTIDEYDKFCRCNTTHNPVDNKEGDPNLDQNKSIEGPIHMIEGLY